jgi:hypothetical protein
LASTSQFVSPTTQQPTAAILNFVLYPESSSDHVSLAAPWDILPNIARQTTHRNVNLNRHSNINAEQLEMNAFEFKKHGAMRKMLVERPQQWPSLNKWKISLKQF